MKKFTLDLDEDLHMRLEAYAASRAGYVSMAQVVREAVAEKLGREAAARESIKRANERADDERMDDDEGWSR